MAHEFEGGVFARRPAGHGLGALQAITEHLGRQPG